MKKKSSIATISAYISTLRRDRLKNALIQRSSNLLCLWLEFYAIQVHNHRIFDENYYQCVSENKQNKNKMQLNKTLNYIETKL